MTQRFLLRSTLPLLVAGLVVAACSDSSGPNKSNVKLIDCPVSVGGGDNMGRAFYVDSFPGSTLKSVTSYFTATGSGDRLIALTAHDATFDGTVIGSDTVKISAADGDTGVAATFDLGGASVTTGATVAFDYTVVSDTGGALFMQTTTTNATCPVTQTNGNTPPLDTDRRNGLPMVIRGKE